MKAGAAGAGRAGAAGGEEEGENEGGGHGREPRVREGVPADTWMNPTGRPTSGTATSIRHRDRGFPHLPDVGRGDAPVCEQPHHRREPVGMDRGEESAVRLGVRENDAKGERNLGVEADVRRDPGEVRLAPPGTTSRSASMTASGWTGIAEASRCRTTFDPSAISQACPSRPNPVTSVSAETAPLAARTSPAARFSSAMTAVTPGDLLRGGRAALDGGGEDARTERLREQELVPGPAPTLRRTRSGWTRPVTAIPYLGSGSSMLWPPRMGAPAEGGGLRPAAEDLRQHLHGQLAHREGRRGSARRSGGRPWPRRRRRRWRRRCGRTSKGRPPPA